MITLELVDKLQPSEWDELKRFIDFNSPRIRKDVYRVLDILKNYSPKTVQFTRKEIHDQLYPQSKFNDKTIRYLLTDLNRLIFDYLGYKQLSSNQYQGQLLLLQELSDRKCHRSFEKKYNQELKKLDSSRRADTDRLYYKYRLHSLKAKSELESGQRSSDVFEESSLYLDNYFVAKKLQISAEKINLNFILKKDWSDPFLSNILEQIDQGLFDSSPYIRLYRLIIKSLTDQDNETVFEQLKAQVPQSIDQLSLSELADLYQYLLNYCIRRINAGRLNFQDELLSVYRSALEHGALFTDGRISQWDFKNVVTIALRTKQIDYAREFIYTYKPSLPADQRTNAIAYNLANLHFAEGDYRGAIKQLQMVDLDDVFYRLDARSILLKSYYELDDTDALYYHGTAFRSFLNRNRKISDIQRKLFLNLIKHTLSLTKLGADRSRLKLIEKGIQENPNVADLSWLEQKISELNA